MDCRLSAHQQPHRFLPSPLPKTGHHPHPPKHLKPRVPSHYPPLHFPPPCLHPSNSLIVHSSVPQGSNPGLTRFILYTRKRHPPIVIFSTAVTMSKSTSLAKPSIWPTSRPQHGPCLHDPLLSSLNTSHLTYIARLCSSLSSIKTLMHIFITSRLNYNISLLGFFFLPLPSLMSCFIVIYLI